MGKIFFVQNGVVKSKDEVLEKWSKTDFVKATQNIESKGWLLDVLMCVEKIKRPAFSLEERLLFFETNTQNTGLICKGVAMHKTGINSNRLWWILICGVFLTSCALGQVPDRSYRPVIAEPAYSQGEGPIVCLDEAHNNFHTLEGRFWAFGELLRKDGYQVEASREKFSASVLAACDILVISNAQLDIEEWGDYPYPTPSAFSDDEINALQTWVEDGGSLLLIADHMPLAGVASDLAAAFGVTFYNGFAVTGFKDFNQLDAAFDKPTIFSIKTNTLISSVITQGRSSSETVTSVRSFTGQAFQAPESAQPVLVLPDDFVLLMPETAWEFSPDTKTISAGGWLQGAVLSFGNGRAAFFGEAAMFSAQRSAGEPEIGRAHV